MAFEGSNSTSGAGPALQFTASLRSRFIVVEGIDGSGKTALCRGLAKYLIGLGQQVFLTAEPSNGPLGGILRQYLVGRLKLDSRTLPYLFAADRSDHLWNPENGVEERLRQGMFVVCDRYVLSSLAYQGAEGNYELACRLNADAPKPDITFFLRLDPSRAVSRRGSERSVAEVYESLGRQTDIAIQFERALGEFGREHKVMVIETKELNEAQVRDVAIAKLMEVISAR